MTSPTGSLCNSAGSFYFILSRKSSRIIVNMATNAAKAVLKQGKSVLLICDVQEKFAKVMFEFDKITQNSVKLVNM